MWWVGVAPLQVIFPFSTFCTLPVCDRHQCLKTGSELQLLHISVYEPRQKHPWKKSFLYLTMASWWYASRCSTPESFLGVTLLLPRSSLCEYYHHTLRPYLISFSRETNFFQSTICKRHGIHIFTRNYSW